MNKRLFLFWGVLAGLVVLVSGGYLVWKNFLAYDEVKLYEKITKDYVEAMTADTYGGKTPQETLDLFVDALRKGDVELASKYFMLDDNLSREKWLDRLSDIKNRDLLNIMAQDISTAEFYKKINDESENFIIYNDDKTDSLLINMAFNKYSEVWKIESL